MRAGCPTPGLESGATDNQRIRSRACSGGQPTAAYRCRLADQASGRVRLSDPSRRTGVPQHIDFTGALAVDDVPDKLAIVGRDRVIGIEMAAIYTALVSL